MVGAAAMEAVEARAKRGRPKGDLLLGDPEAKRRALALAPAPWPSPPPPPQPQPHHPASRIYRVSRASGGKDRHSKVYTAKGIRDRRVRLSVATAIQFYDLQDRLGYDQPSKAIEWLIKAAADAIDKLPSLDAAAGFPTHPASAAGKERAAATATATATATDQQQLTGSGCSSTSETSKGSVLSLSRSESRVKARDRARERSACAAAAATSDKDPGARDDAEPATAATASAQQAQAASFTELLTGMAAAEHKQHQQPPPCSSWHPMPVSTADYIGFAQQPRKGFAAPAPHLANIAAAPVTMASSGSAAAHHHFGLATGAVTVASAGTAAEPHAEMTTHFSFLQDHFMPPVHAAPTPAHASVHAPAGEYNLSFSMSSGLVGVNNTRGPLQSNSQPHISAHHHHHQLQRLSTPLDTPSNIPFLFGQAAAATPAAAESQFAAAFQLWNGGFQHADMKEKGKN